ncbi:MAG: hypothetical protein ACK4MV_07835 [Beijerinckiaceae bacterium]
MRLAIKTLICAVAAILGYGAGALFGLVLLELAGVSMFEGERASLAALMIGPLGAIAGLWGGGWAAQRLFHEPTSFGSIARIAGVAFVAINVLAALGAVVGSLTFGDPRWLNSAPPNMDFEIRLPASSLGPDEGRRWRVNLDTPHNQMPATLIRPFSREGDFVLVAGKVDLAYRTSQRILTLDLGDGGSLVFQLSIPSTPKSTGWSAWAGVSGVFRSGDTRARPPGPGYVGEIRTRVIVH